MVSVAGTVSIISDEKALSLFKAIALSEKESTNILITKLGLTRRQYYSIMKKLIDTGLVKRISGNYSLTSFGKITFDVQVKIENAINNYWKLKAIDLIIKSVDRKELPVEEYQRIIDNLIDNHEIKTTILTSNDKFESNQFYDSAGQQQLRRLQPQQTRQLKQELLIQ